MHRLNGISQKTIRKSPALTSRASFVSQLDCAGNFTGTQAPGTNIYMARRTVDNRLHTLYVGLPGTIGTSVGMGNLDTESYALIAKLTLSHPLHLLALVTYWLLVHHKQ